LRAGLLVLPFAAFGTAAQACPPFQLSAYPNPPPQAANVTYTFDRGLYGNGQPGYILNSGGVPGCPGGPGPPGGSGGSGQGGQAAGQITTNTTNAVVIGTGVIGTAGVGQPGLHYGALISASGGDGGDGGTSGSVDNSFVVGGAAGAGAAGGVITGQFGGNIFPNGSDVAAVDIALLARCATS